MSIPSNSDRYIRLSDRAYPFSYHEVMQNNPITGLMDLLPSQQLPSFGFALVVPTLQPGPEFREGSPEFVHNHWKQTWVKDPTPMEIDIVLPLSLEDELRLDKSNAMKRLRRIKELTMNQGVPYDFGESGVYFMQLRPKDRNAAELLLFQIWHFAGSTIPFSPCDGIHLRLTPIQAGRVHNAWFLNYNCILREEVKLIQAIIRAPSESAFPKLPDSLL